jgi:hypothetical protein
MPHDYGTAVGRRMVFRPVVTGYQLPTFRDLYNDSESYNGMQDNGVLLIYCEMANVN